MCSFSVAFSITFLAYYSSPCGVHIDRLRVVCELLNSDRISFVPLIRKRKEPADGRAPLTIFYGGKMVVFDDFPAEKAEELMQLAGSGGNAAPAAENALGQPSLTGRNGTRIPTLSSSPVFTRIIAEGKAKSPRSVHTIQRAESDSIYLSRACTFLTDMPLARKVSLKRFLEKRKNRLTAADPYPAAASESSTKQPPAVKEEGAPWLGVCSALSLS